MLMMHSSPFTGSLHRNMIHLSSDFGELEIWFLNSPHQLKLKSMYELLH